MRSLIAQELDKLGVDVQQLESAAKRRTQIAAEQREVSRRIDAHRNRAIQDKLSLDQIQESQRRLMELADNLSQLKDDYNEWEQLRSEKAKTLSEIEVIEIRERQKDEVAKDISNLADEINFAKQKRPTEPELLANIISSHLQAQAAELQKHFITRNRLLEIMKQAERRAADLQELEKKLRELENRKEGIAKARKQVDGSLENIRSLVRAATRAKTRLLDRVFNEDLNGLLDEIYSRLVKFEKFKPHLSELTSTRNKIHAGIQGITEGVEPFAHAAAVLSTGNLNTAALSLFLSLHLIVEPRHRLLVLDDPVQSMDDIHVVNLASVLRTIVHQARRQLVRGLNWLAPM